jgi:rfaE bifunctional protein kinase chain/domain
MQLKITAKRLKQLFHQMSEVRIFVIGDAMLDHYWMGKIDRISPEAPVPVVSVQSKKTLPGGAANVALNCKALGAEVSLLTVIGNDEGGKMLQHLLESKGISTEHVLQSKERTTTSKTRIIARNQQMIRIDEETDHDLSTQDEHRFINLCLKAIQIETPHIVIFEDYNKGVLKENVISKLIGHCRMLGIMTAVDPKRMNFFKYQHVDLFKPNLKEIREALQMEEINLSKEYIKKMAKALHQKIDHQLTLITLSELGIFAMDHSSTFIVPAHIRQIADVSGAGDTVIAVASMLYYLSKDSHITASISNLAGGLVCEELGVVPIDKKKLLNESLQLLTN